MSKSQRQERFERRKAKHVRDIRALDYLMGQKAQVEYGGGSSHNDGSPYNIARALNIHKRGRRGGGNVGGNPRYSDTRTKFTALDTEAA